CQQGYTYLYTF
nr:immunoglobulin light chain junction region [Macaca mulatta]